ncbi:MAG TPA: SAP domain-containing protein, partial [Candidatus Thalassarchaeaceae archaeon]|nr:SAP domain-containing protein [Candidatus Thalassarchaeaceae archaeon]
MVDDERSPDDSELPLDDGVYITDEDDTFEKMKRGLKKFGKDLKKGAEDIADSSKKLATKSKEKMDAALEERKRKKAMKDPLNFPWSNLTVSELKERLREMGLAVSGKKDQLVERILEHYRTEIPTDEDGTPQLIEELEPVLETPPAPDLDELVKTDVVIKEVVEEVISEPTTVVEEVATETPVYQFEASEQMYVYDPPKNMKKKKKKARKVSNNVNLIYGLLMLVLTVTILNNGFDMGLNLGMIYDFIGECFVGSYGGMSDSQTTALAGMLSLILFMASLMYISGRQYAAAYLAKISIVVSISIRLFATFDEGVSDTMDI